MIVDGGRRFVYPRRSSSRDKKRTQSMANSPSAKKRARQADRRTVINKARRSRVRTFIRKVEEAIASGDQARSSHVQPTSVLIDSICKSVRRRNAWRVFMR